VKVNVRDSLDDAFRERQAWNHMCARWSMYGNERSELKSTVGAINIIRDATVAEPVMCRSRTTRRCSGAPGGSYQARLNSSPWKAMDGPS